MAVVKITLWRWNGSIQTQHLVQKKERDSTLQLFITTSSLIHQYSLPEISLWQLNTSRPFQQVSIDRSSTAYSSTSYSSTSFPSFAIFHKLSIHNHSTRRGSIERHVSGLFISLPCHSFAPQRFFLHRDSGMPRARTHFAAPCRPALHLWPRVR